MKEVIYPKDQDTHADTHTSMQILNVVQKAT